MELKTDFFDVAVVLLALLLIAGGAYGLVSSAPTDSGSDPAETRYKYTVTGQVDTGPGSNDLDDISFTRSECGFGDNLFFLGYDESGRVQLVNGDSNVVLQSQDYDAGIVSGNPEFSFTTKCYADVPPLQVNLYEDGALVEESEVQT